MMLDPDEFKIMNEGKEYSELCSVRDSLIKEIHKYEKKPPAIQEQLVKPSPHTMYLMNLKYLSIICDLMAQYKQGNADSCTENPTEI